MKYDLGFGNSPCVREAFVNTYNGNPIQFNREDLLKFDYPTHEGDPALVEITRKVIKRQIDKEYKHVFLVNGATGGCVISLRAYQLRGKTQCITRTPPFYARYPGMIESSGLIQIFDEGFWQSPISDVALLDIPSNPLGMTDSNIAPGIPIILDGVYLNNVYMPPTSVKTVPHEVFVGSYSKLLGLNGIRLGWIATDDDLLADRIKKLITSEYCGLSTGSTEILKSALEGFDWEKFEISAREKLDNNREEWSKLERFFGNPVGPYGMFHYAPMDNKAQEIFYKAGIFWTKGLLMGTNDGFARFNLGQTNEVIQEAVNSVLKVDRIK